jgi:hypothetical protein
MTNHCQRDNPSDGPAGNVTDITALRDLKEQRDRAEAEALRSEQRQTGGHEAEFHPLEEASSSGTPWLGPVADTVLIDFLFYGLFIAVPVLFMWIFFGRWWIFRNMEWVGLACAVWFVILWGWRRKDAN